MSTVRAKYENGVLTPLEPLDLEEGAEVTVSVKGASGAAKGKESILDMFDRLRNSVPPNAWDNMPTDGAKNYRRYLYGHPSRVLELTSIR